ncbi:MAG: FtsX-like permease family protein [Deltaproteobacteria bacterium]|nr:FtsX-like permease family protein [Deltaproteobacteria bacterium]
MNIMTIPARNAMRKPARLILLTLVFTLGVTSTVALVKVSGAIEDGLEKKLIAYGANILVTPRTETLEVSYGGLNVGSLTYDVSLLEAEPTLRALKGIEHARRLSAVAPKIVHLARTESGRAVLVGVDWEQELSIKQYWVVQGRVPGAAREVLVGATAATSLGLAPGKMMDIDGREFTVAGILEPTGGDEDRVLFSSLDTVQELAGTPGRINFVEVAALCAGCPIGEIVDQIGAALPNLEVRALRSVVEQRMGYLDFVRTLVLAVCAIILISACAMIGATMLSAVNERRREIGILRSLGFSGGQVFFIFCLEALLTGMVAGVIGYAAGHAVSLHVGRALDIIRAGKFHFDPAQGLLVCALVCLLTIAAAAFPSWKASKIEPSQALISL